MRVIKSCNLEGKGVGSVIGQAIVDWRYQRKDWVRIRYYSIFNKVKLPM